MRIAVGSDEVTPLTEALIAALAEAGHEVDLHGPLAGGDEEWVEASAGVARAVAEGRCERGVACCWSGTGASIAANKIPGARAALCADAETARMARRYNHANVLALSLRLTSPRWAGRSWPRSWRSRTAPTSSIGATWAGSRSWTRPSRRPGSRGR